MGILSFGYTKSRQVDVIFNIRPIVFLLFLCDDTIVLGICKNKLSRNRNEGTLVGISLGCGYGGLSGPRKCKRGGAWEMKRTYVARNQTKNKGV